MAKTITAIIGEVAYMLPRLNIGQIEELYDIWNAEGAEGGAGSLRGTLAVAAIALRRADPKIADVRALECDASEISAAVNAVFVLSGLIKRPAPGAEAIPGEAEAGQAPAAPIETF